MDVHASLLMSFQVSRASVRRLLARMLPTDADLEMFCLDFFPAVAHQLGGGMERRRKENLLLATVDIADVLAGLERLDRDSFARHRHLLEPGLTLTPGRRRLGCLVFIGFSVAGGSVTLISSLFTTPGALRLAIADLPDHPRSPELLIPARPAVKVPSPPPNGLPRRPDKGRTAPTPPPLIPFDIRVRTRIGESLTLCPRQGACEHPQSSVPTSSGGVVTGKFTVPPGDYVVTCRQGPHARTVHVTVGEKDIDDISCFAPLP